MAFDIQKTKKAGKDVTEQYTMGARFNLDGPHAEKVFTEEYEPQGFTKVKGTEKAAAKPEAVQTTLDLKETEKK